jgi:hypothetical protein
MVGPYLPEHKDSRQMALRVYHERSCYSNYYRKG